VTNCARNHQHELGRIHATALLSLCCRLRVSKGASVVNGGCNLRTDPTLPLFTAASYPVCSRSPRLPRPHSAPALRLRFRTLDLAAPGCGDRDSTVPRSLRRSSASPDRIHSPIDVRTSQVSTDVFAGVAALLFSLYPHASAAGGGDRALLEVGREPARRGLTPCAASLDAAPHPRVSLPRSAGGAAAQPATALTPTTDGRTLPCASASLAA